ncbi:MAG: O-antigen ligase family protein [Gemmatimonadales bacterium]
MTAAILATLLLPPIYQAHSSFITPTMPTGKTPADESSPSTSLPGGSSRALLAPSYYATIIESETLRRSLLSSRFGDPRAYPRFDSIPLALILRPNEKDERRRVDLGSRQLAKAISTRFDGTTSVVDVEVRMRWPELAAAVTNRAVELANALGDKHRGERAASETHFSEELAANAKSALAQAANEQRLFEERNREWNSPSLQSAHALLVANGRLAAQKSFAYEQRLDASRLRERTGISTITIVDRAIPPRKAQWPRYARLLASALVTSFLVAFLVTGILVFAASPKPSAPVVLSTRAEPDPSWLSRVGFPLFAFGLIFHSLIITALFGWLGLPVDTVRTIAAWKEFSLALILSVVVIRAFTGRGQKSRLAWTDMWIGGLLATAFLFLLVENLWLRLNLPPAAEMLGFRDAVYFMLLYFVGRSMPQLAMTDGAMRKLFGLVFLTAMIGVVERAFVAPEMLVGLGVAAYFQDFLGVSAFTVGNVYGLPLNYWTMIGGHLFRRAGSVYLSGQGFAVPFLLFFPLATAWVFLRPKRSSAQVTAYLVIAASLILTLTRMTILIALIQLVLFVSLRRRPEWAVVGLMVAAVVFLSAFALIPGFPTFVWETLSWQEGSSISHVNDWTSGLAVFFQNPWGSGLGTADQSAVRSGLKHLTGDNLYLKYGVEMGALGLSLLVLSLVAIGRTGFQLYRRGVSMAQQRMGITLWLAAIGIAINGITAVVFSSITLGWLFFWLAGAAVTAAQSLPVTAEPAR